MESKDRILVDALLYPAFYPKFQCIADRCRNNCCHGWNIPFSKRDYLRIKRAEKSPEREKLFRAVVLASRALFHNHQRQAELRDQLFHNDSATLAHMAVLVKG